jgi:bifunctional UDP-N-acetylglucosamine pyrophosphorylase/glucosamine-1-phosphate N-acetyltransferase
MTQLQEKTMTTDAAYYDELREKNRNRNLEYAKQGVLFRDLDSVFIEDGVVIGAGTSVAQSVTISGTTVIGDACVIGQGCEIIDATIASHCEILHHTRLLSSEVGEGSSVTNSVVTQSSIGQNTNVGPFAYIRPNSVIADHVKIGDFVEIKNSVIGAGTKVSHLTYVGDSDLGKDINLGCGVVFVNYNGKEKNRSRIGDGAFIGCNVNIISPVEIGDHAYIAAGTTLTRNVPAGSLGIGRARQESFEGWVEKSGLLKKD